MCVPTQCHLLSPCELRNPPQVPGTSNIFTSIAAAALTGPWGAGSGGVVLNVARYCTPPCVTAAAGGACPPVCATLCATGVCRLQHSVTYCAAVQVPSARSSVARPSVARPSWRAYAPL